MTGETEASRINTLYRLLIEAQSYSFPIKGVLDTCRQRGVYIIYDAENNVAHVGNTPRAREGICQRLNDHLHGSSSFSKEYLKPNRLSLRNGFTFKYLEVADGRHRMLLQALAIGLLCPKHIGLGFKSTQKIP